MQRSIFLAKLIGPVFVAIGLGLLLNGPVFRAMAVQFLHNHALIYLSGLIALVTSLALVNAHNVWTADWRAIISALGWLATLGGICRIVAPQFVESVGLRVIESPVPLMIEGFVMLVAGGVLAYFGYAEFFEQKPARHSRRKRSR